MRSQNRLLLFLIPLAGALLFPACAHLQARHALRECEFLLAGISVEGASLSHVALEVALDCHNPSGERTVVIDPFDWELTSGSHLLASGTVDSTHQITSRQTTRIQIPAHITFAEVGKALYESVRSGDASYRLEVTFWTPFLLFRLPHTVVLLKKGMGP